MRDALQVLVAQKREAGIRPEFRDKVTDAEILGRLVAEYLGWSGNRILVAASAALADANFHEAARTVKGMSLHPSQSSHLGGDDG
jgi:hypothetical protein